MIIQHTAGNGIKPYVMFLFYKVAEAVAEFMDKIPRPDGFNEITDIHFVPCTELDKVSELSETHYPCISSCFISFSKSSDNGEMILKLMSTINLFEENDHGPNDQFGIHITFRNMPASIFVKCILDDAGIFNADIVTNNASKLDKNTYQDFHHIWQYVVDVLKPYLDNTLSDGSMILSD